MEEAKIKVAGIPRTMGSAKAVPMSRDWRTRAGVRWRVVREGDEKIAKWQEQVASAARTAMFGHDPMNGPLVLQATFTLPRPKGHLGVGGVVKSSAPELPEAKKDDLDKLLRAALDALTGVVYVDDSQIVNLHAWKRYGQPGVQITASRIGGS